MFLFARVISRAPQVLLTVLVFSLASGILGGILFYVDSVGPAVFSDMTSDVDVDMRVEILDPFYQQTALSLDDIDAIVEEQDAVLATEKVALLREYIWGYDRYSISSYLGVDASFFDDFSGRIDVMSAVAPLEPGNCYVSLEQMQAQDLEIGDDFILQFEFYNDSWPPPLVNITFEIAGTFTSDLLKEQLYWEGPEVSTLAMVGDREGMKEAFTNYTSTWTRPLSDEIWVDIDNARVLQEDPALVASHLESLRNRIEQRTLPFAWIGYDGFELLGAVTEFSYWQLGMRAVSLSFSLPTLFMGVMMVYYSNALLADEQRRDVGTIKTRGASGRQALSWVLGSALFIAVVGGVGAIVVGVISGALSATVRSFFEFDLSQLSELKFLLVPSSIVFVFGFSFFVGLVTSVPAAIRALIITPTEAHEVVEGRETVAQEKMSRAGYDVIAAAISGYLLIPLFLVVGYVSVYVPFAASLMIVALPVLGVFLFTVIRLLSRPAARFKFAILHGIRRPPLSVGTLVLSRSALLRRRSEAFGVMFISMVFTAGMFASVAATTGYEHMISIHRFQVGADIAVDVKSDLHNVTTSLIEDIAAVDGVARVSAMLASHCTVSYQTADPYEPGRHLVTQDIALYGVQPEEWLDSAFWLPYFTYFTSPEVALDALALSNSSIIASFKPVWEYLQSWAGLTPVFYDNVTLVLMNGTEEVLRECKIVDVLAASPQNSMSYYFPGESDASSFIIINLAYLHALMNTTEVSKFYVRLDAGANYTRAMEDIAEVAPYSFEMIQSSQHLIDRALEARAGRSLYGVYTLDVLFSLIYLTAGMAIVSSVRVVAMKKQLSVLRALGAENRSMIAALLTDTSISIALGGLIGSAIGLFLAYLVSQMPLVYMGAVEPWTWFRLPVVIAVPWLMLAAIIGGALLGSLFTTYYVAKRGLSGSIAEQVQYAE